MSPEEVKVDEGAGSIRKKREELKLPMLDIDLLYAQSGSPDSTVSEPAKRALRLKWELTPEQDSVNARTESLMDALHKYPENIRRKVVSRITDLQLTQDCNGNCHGCPNGKDKGVSAKFSFDSIVEFFQTYGDDISEHFMMYWQNDPFDYRDGNHSFVDVYSAFRKIRPDQFQYVSTAIPKGSSEDFINFMRNLAYEKKLRKSEDKSVPTKVRISVWKHNIQRIEAVIDKCISDLETEGYTEVEIQRLFTDHVAFESRFDTDIKNIGPLINRADGISSADSIACQDAFVVTPDNQYAVIITTPTPFDPMGEIDIPILDGSNLGSIPKYVHKSTYAHIQTFFNRHLSSPFLPPAMAREGYQLELSDPIDDVCMKLGRSVQSAWLVMNNLSRLPNIGSMPIEETIPLDDAKKQYISAVFDTYKLQRDQILHQIETSKRLVEDTVGVAEQKLQYYAVLSETYILKMDYLDGLFQQGIPFEIIGTISALLNQVGKHEVGNLTLLLNGLDSFHSQVLQKQVYDDDVDHALFNIVSKAFELSETALPQWYVTMCQWYAGWAYECRQEES